MTEEAIQLRQQTKALKLLVWALVEQLPKHSVDCATRRQHPSYGDQNCDCHNKELRDAARELNLREPS